MSLQKQNAEIAICSMHMQLVNEPGMNGTYSTNEVLEQIQVQAINFLLIYVLLIYLKILCPLKILLLFHVVKIEAISK